MSQVELRSHPVGFQRGEEGLINRMLADAPLNAGDFTLLMNAGCGDAIPAVLRHIGSTGHLVVVDADMDDLTAARMRHGKRYNVDFLCADICDMRPFDGLYHSIVLLGRTPCPDPWAQIVRMTCMLIPGGRLIYVHDATLRPGLGISQIADLMHAAGLHVEMEQPYEGGYIVVGEEVVE